MSDGDHTGAGPSGQEGRQTTVTVKVFTDSAAADLAAGVLRTNNLPCWLHADDAGGMYPSLDVTEGIKLMVRAEDADTARALLEAEVLPLTEAEAKRLQKAAPSANASPPPRNPVWIQLLLGVVAGALLCLLYQWTQERGIKTYRLDLDGDGKSDEVWVYRNGRCVEFYGDRNSDGLLDQWCYYDDSGRRTAAKADDNFDGTVDVIWSYTNGVLVSQSADTDFNGTPDVTFRFKHEVVAQADWRPNGTNIVTLRQRFQHGVLTEELRDTNLDGIFDDKIEYDAFQNPISTNAFKLLAPAVP